MYSAYQTVFSVDENFSQAVKSYSFLSGYFAVDLLYVLMEVDAYSIEENNGKLHHGCHKGLFLIP